MLILPLRVDEEGQQGAEGLWVHQHAALVHQQHYLVVVVSMVRYGYLQMVEVTR